MPKNTPTPPATAPSNPPPANDLLPPDGESKPDATPPDMNWEYPTTEWSCKHYPDHSEIEAYNGEGRVSFAHLPQTPGLSPRGMAEYIVALANLFALNQSALKQMKAALELCVEDRNISWAAEHEAEIALIYARQLELAQKEAFVQVMG
jgi:hypothetical protein